ncbi:MAG: GFA family protein [Pseudolabrys sp.]
MRLEGGCYCGAVRYIAEGEPVLRAQCHCRACQYFSGGAPNLFMLVPAEGFAYTKGAPKTYRRPDKADAVTREFCAVCGTHMISRRLGLRPVVLKIGTLDDPSVYAARKRRSSRQKVSLSISLRTACPPLKACRRANSSNQPRRWCWCAGCGARSLLGH